MIASAINLIFNLTFLVAMTNIAGFIQQRNDSRISGDVLLGLLFGFSAVVGMMNPLVLGPGLIFDGRSVMVSICALFFGPVAVGVAGGAALLYRIFVVGGSGVIMGALVIASSAIIGLVFHAAWRGRKQPISAMRLLAFGVLVHVAMVLLMFSLPGGSGLRVIRQIGLPVLLAYPLATLLVGKILSNREAELLSNAALRESRAALGKGRAQLRTLIDSIPDLVWIKDLEGKYLECNHRFERLFGAKKADILGKTDCDFVDPELASFFRANDQRAVLAGRPTVNEERLRFADDGHQEDLETIKTPIVGTDGAVLGVLGIGRDITGRKKAEAELRQSEARFRALSENMGEWIWEVDTEGIYRYSNAAVTHILGYAQEELVGRLHYYDISPAEGRESLMARVQEAFEARKPLAAIVNRNLHRNGTAVWVEMIGVPMFDSDGQFQGYRGSSRDVTRRKEAEDALREANQLNEQVLRSAHEGIIVYGPDLRYQVWNPYMENLSGTSTDELLGKHPMEVYPFLAETDVMERLEAALAGGTSGPRDYQYRFPRTGKSGWAIDTTAPLRNTLGEIVGVIRTFRDATERKQAEEALKDSEYFFRESQRAAAIGSYKVDFKTGRWESSGILDEIFGIDANYPRSLPGWLELIHPDDKTMMDRYLREEVIDARRPFSKEYRIVRKQNGETRWVFGLGKVTYAGASQFMIGTIQDITERKRTEEALRESGERLSAITESALDAILIMDQDGCIAHWNKAATRMFGYSSDEAIGRKLHQLIVPERYREEHQAGFPGFQRTGKGLTIDAMFEVEACHKDGGEFFIEVSISALKLRGSWHAVGILRDITKRKNAEAEKSRLEAQLQQAQKMESLGNLVAGVAHNINNVLAIIMGTASFREQSASEPSDLKAYRTIGRACTRGRDVVRSLVQFAKPTISHQAPFELHALIQELCNLLENTTSNRIEILETFADEPLWINGDAGTFNHALLNLSINSVDAMPHGGTLTFRTHILDPHWVEVSVEDSGEGIAPAVLAKVMEPFFTTKDENKGTGLGLSMAYGVIKAHGGTIDIASQPGLGTTVKIRVPRIPAPAQGESGAAPLPLPGSMAIFLIDDDEEVRSLMARMLRQAGVRRVRSFARAEEALEALHPGAFPDLIIVDENMPGLDGAQTMERIHSLHPDLPILISSGQPGVEELACFKRPRVAVISKPFTMLEIRSKLAQFAQENDAPAKGPSGP